MTLSSRLPHSLDYAFVGTGERPPSENPLWADVALISKDKQKEMLTKKIQEGGLREKVDPALQAPTEWAWA